MPTVLVRGLAEEGPGDVVGAFVGEADVDPDRIGEIGIDGGEATVELALERDVFDDFLEYARARRRVVEPDRRRTRERVGDRQ